MAKSLADLEKIVEKLAAIIEAPASLLPTYGRSLDGAHPHVEADLAGMWHYVIVERGQELERKTTGDLDDLLYWIFANVTFSMAVKYEGKTRVSGQDFRRIMFQKQEELLGELNENWQRREEQEHRLILGKHPFDDQN
ncbi:MAG: Imm63 family immunity protein [Dyadobacter sp.]|uniref:Imm63 family immunity protein n=1 Tax=Dyadobacter sp. TaxID=1914288 RepID=UPI00326628E0